MTAERVHAATEEAEGRLWGGTLAAAAARAETCGRGRSPAAVSYGVDSGDGPDGHGRRIGLNVGMAAHPTTSSPSPPGRWRRLVRALWDMIGPYETLGVSPASEVVAEASEGRRLHICTACGSDVVNPAHAEPLDEHRWTMVLRCGACGETTNRIVSNEAAQSYDYALNRGFDAIARALERVEREDMEEWAGTFLTALGRDLIDAEDFAHRR